MEIRPKPGNESVPIISVRNLTVGYGDEIILQDVSFDIYEGEIFAILGRSGCGKTTLFKAMTGLVEIQDGEVEIDGERMVSFSEGKSENILKKIGILFQSGALFSSQTIAENVAFPMRLHTSLPESTIERLVALKLEIVGLAGKERALPAELSGGMQKRAALARAMSLDPSILFFDEPSAGLDPITGAGLDHTILKIKETLGTTIVIVTHELASIFSIVDRAVMLDPEAKTVIAQGSPRRLRDESSDRRVREFFNRLPEQDGNV